MKNHFMTALLCFCMSGTIAIAQQKKPTTTTTKKPTTTVKTTTSKTPAKTTTTKTTTTTTTSPVVTAPVEEKKTTTTTTTTTSPTNNSQTNTPSSTTTIQSSGPSKGNKTKPAPEPKPEKVREPKPERERPAREPKPEKVRKPRESSGDKGGVSFGLRAEANQVFSFESGGSLDIAPGVNAGLIVNIPISEAIAIQPEVLYSMANVKVSVGADYDKTTTGSILAPITFNIKLGQGPTKFMINPGGYADYLLSFNSEESTGGVKTSVTGDLTNVDRFGYGAVLGLGVKLGGGLMIETRAFYDLKNSNNKSILATFGIGYMF
jgi:hypothetical protein